ncbi:MAG: DinB family protein [Gemmatimonadota bacterium]
MDGSMWLPEFDHEFGETRKALERVPEDQFAWSPHEKSWSLHDLAAHLAEVPHWTAPTLETDTMDLDAEPYERVVPETKEAILAHFDAGVEQARAAIAQADGAKLGETWRMIHGGEVTIEMPKGAVLRSFILNHNVHHRAQLGVYLRLLGVPVPGHYGPTADDIEQAAEA